MAMSGDLHTQHTQLLYVTLTDEQRRSAAVTLAELVENRDDLSMALQALDLARLADDGRLWPTTGESGESWWRASQRVKQRR